jgi:predicted acetyltransferase
MSNLFLRPLTIHDEVQFMAAHEQLLSDGFTFALGREPEMTWQSYLDRLEANRLGVELAEGNVPSTFLVADVDGKIVGRTSIRHELNEFLASEGGHIGFGVVPEERRKGYATQILRQSLEVARALGVERVLITCSDDNIGSAAVIVRCDGVFESAVVGSKGKLVRRYRIG